MLSCEVTKSKMAGASELFTSATGTRQFAANTSLTYTQEFVTGSTEATSGESEENLSPTNANLMNFYMWYAKYHGHLSIVVCVFGIVCNVFNIIVLTQPHMKTTTNWILTALAVSDLLTMASYIPFALQFYCLHGTQPSPGRNSEHWINFLLFHINFSVTTHTTSIWLGVLLAVFRYWSVRCSARGNIPKIGFHETKIGIAVVYVATVIVLVPNYMSVRVVTDIYEPTNETVYRLESIDTGSNFGYVVTKLNFWIHALVIKLVPCALMSIFGALLIGMMRMSQRRRKQLRQKSAGSSGAGQSLTGNGATGKRNSARTRDHTRTTAMLVAVIVLFLLTELPQGILALCSGLINNFFHAYYMPLGDVMDMAALLNNAINFTLYCSMSKQFRDTFLKLFCPRKLLSRKKKFAEVVSILCHDYKVTCVSEYCIRKKQNPTMVIIF